jgi:hypothetical protein
MKFKVLRLIPVFFLAAALLAVAWNTNTFAQYGDGETSYTLSVSKAGSGTITSNPTGINCGTVCSVIFSGETTVTLTATPTSGYVFTSWFNTAGCSTGSCQITMNANKSATATFQPTLVVNKSGAGSGTVAATSGTSTLFNCASFPCTNALPQDTSVVLTATPASGSTVGTWSGCNSVTADNKCNVAMNTPKTVAITFNTTGVPVGDVVPPPVVYLLSVAKAGTGGGTVSSSPVGIDCGATCSKTFPAGTVVTLTATPSTDSNFTGWSGNCAGMATTVTTTMSAARNCAATFVLKTAPPAGCGNETVAGRCDGNTVIWCDAASQSIQQTNCSAISKVCGFDSAARIYTCLTSVTPLPPAVPPPPGTGECPAIGYSGVSLKRGMKDPVLGGPQITSLQIALNAYLPLPKTSDATYCAASGLAAGCLAAKLIPDGDFGRKTSAAVRAYQDKKGVALVGLVDGIAGMKTASALQSDYSACLGGTPPSPTPPTPPSEPISCAEGFYPMPTIGECGTPEQVFAAIRPLSDRLSLASPTLRSGAPLASDPGAVVAAKLLHFFRHAPADYSARAFWDSDLIKAVVVFQSSAGLTPDGLAGRLTITSLLEKYLVNAGLLSPGARFDPNSIL